MTTRNFQTLVAIIFFCGVVALSKAENQNQVKRGGVVADLPRCGVVYDGTGVGDLERQTASRFISTRWYGFEPPGSHLLNFEWAIVSDKIAPSTFLLSGCDRSAGFEGKADVQDWVAVTKGQSWAVNESVELRLGTTYFVVLHAFLNGNRQGGLFAHSDGTLIVSDLDNYDEYGYDQEDEEDEEENKGDGKEDEVEVIGGNQEGQKITKKRSLNNVVFKRNAHINIKDKINKATKHNGSVEDSFDDQAIIGVVFAITLVVLILLICICSCFALIMLKVYGNENDKYADK